MKERQLQHLALTARRAVAVIEALYPLIEGSKEIGGTHRILLELEDGATRGSLTHDLARLLVDLPEVAEELERLARRDGRMVIRWDIPPEELERFREQWEAELAKGHALTPIIPDTSIITLNEDPQPEVPHE